MIIITKSKLNICNALTEISILLIMSSTSVYLFNLNQGTISEFESVIAITITAMVIQAFASIAIFTRALYEIIHRKLTKGGIVRRNINMYKPHFKKVIMSNWIRDFSLDSNFEL
ncbi:unnamed protein product [Blepharisma stoltei]|uniref:Uncharacterized protein n=1 Tax=Blepharisma stoltei TaxID=1481888 RepID=A0AAU9KCF3_9CILI|nr:unnamed protein product [Blepharisma stoltei]